MESNIN